MSTVSVTYDYVYFGGGAGYTRQPRSATGPGGFALINSLSGGTLQTGDSFAAGAQPSTLTTGDPSALPPIPGKTYVFAFMNVSGGTPAGGTTPSGVSSFSSAAPPPAVTVGSAPIVVLVVYVPTGDGVGGGSDAFIDSFDETTGQLFGDTFVTVSPDPGGPPPPLTTTGNVDGYVSTTNTETIEALSPTSSKVVFEEWQLLYPQATSRFLIGPKGPIVETIDPAGISVSGANLTVNSNTSVYALAFYKAPPPATTHPLTTCQRLLLNWTDLEPKTNLVLLAYYEEKLSACTGAQYAAAVQEIKALIQELQRGPNRPPKPPIRE